MRYFVRALVRIFVRSLVRSFARSFEPYVVLQNDTHAIPGDEKSNSIISLENVITAFFRGRFCARRRVAKREKSWEGAGNRISEWRPCGRDF